MTVLFYYRQERDAVHCNRTVQLHIFLALFLSL